MFPTGKFLIFKYDISVKGILRYFNTGYSRLKKKLDIESPIALIGHKIYIFWCNYVIAFKYLSHWKTHQKK